MVKTVEMFTFLVFLKGETQDWNLCVDVENSRGCRKGRPLSGRLRGSVDNLES